MTGTLNHPSSRSKSTNGRVGAMSEMVAASFLLGLGYFVYRSVSPDSPVDLIAQSGEDLLCVEVTSGRMKIRQKPGSRQVYYNIHNKPRCKWDLMAVVLPSGDILWRLPGEDHSDPLWVDFPLEVPVETTA